MWFRAIVACLLLVPLGGCFGYRLVRPEEIELPSYEPRPVIIPAQCDTLIDRTAAGAALPSEEEARMLNFCQHQQLIRAQEEEAAAKRLEAHAETARFAVYVTTVVVGALIAVLTWVF